MKSIAFEVNSGEKNQEFSHVPGLLRKLNVYLVSVGDCFNITIYWLCITLLLPEFRHKPYFLPWTSLLSLPYIQLLLGYTKLAVSHTSVLWMQPPWCKTFAITLTPFPFSATISDSRAHRVFSLFSASPFFWHSRNTILSSLLSWNSEIA